MRSVLATILLACLLSAELYSQPYYGPPNTIGLSEDRPVLIEKIRSADLNGDGLDDVVLAACFQSRCDSLYSCITVPCSGSVAWYANDGTGNFALMPFIIEDGSFTRHLFLRDIDDDGDVDVLRASNFLVTWHENDGSGQFTDHVILDNGAYDIRDVSASDLDGDGDLDILANVRDPNFAYSLSWMENRGDSGFGPTVTIESAASHQARMIGTDLDNDSDLDVAVTNGPSGQFYWIENDASGNFSSVTNIPASDNVFDIFELASADLDGNGLNDMICRGNTFNRISVFYNNGEDGFDGPHYLSGGNNEDHAYISDNTMWLQDMDADGDPDLITTTTSQERDSPDRIVINVNTGSSFQAQTLLVPQGGVLAVSASNVFGDTLPDVLFAYRGSAFGAVVNHGNLDFSTVRMIRNINYSVNGDHIGDLDRDGHPDILLRSSLPPVPGLLRNDGNNAFEDAVFYPGLARGEWGKAYADVDGDGDTDLISVDHDPNRILWYENDGSAQFPIAHQISAIGASGIAARDLNDDGILDFLTYSGGELVAFTTLLQPVEAYIESTLESGLRYTDNWLLTDLNIDGLEDFARFARFGETLSYYPNAGGFSLGEEVIIGILEDPFFMDAADLNGDGAADVIAATREGKEIYWYSNDGEGRFSEGRLIGSYDNDFELVLLDDVDGDGNTDVLVNKSNAQSGITWLENDGEGNFTERFHELDGDPFLTNLGDIDGDYCPDLLAFSTTATGSMQWHEHLTTCSPPDTSISDTTVTFQGDEFQFSVSVYPNPFSEYTSVRWSSPPGIEPHAMLYDISGSLIRQFSVPGDREWMLHRDGLSPGIYFLRIADPSSGNPNLMHKIIVR